VRVRKERALVPIATRGPPWVKGGNTRCGQMFSAPHPITDIEQWVCMSGLCQTRTSWITLIADEAHALFDGARPMDFPAL